MNLPTTSPTPEEIHAIWAKAEEVARKWVLVKTNTASVEFALYRDELAEAVEGLNKVQDFVDGQILEWRAKRVPVAGKLEELESLDRRAKDHYFRTREAEHEATGG